VSRTICDVGVVKENKTTEGDVPMLSASSLHLWLSPSTCSFRLSHWYWHLDGIAKLLIIPLTKLG